MVSYSKKQLCAAEITATTTITTAGCTWKNVADAGLLQRIARVFVRQFLRTSLFNALVLSITGRNGPGGS